MDGIGHPLGRQFLQQSFPHLARSQGIIALEAADFQFADQDVRCPAMTGEPHQRLGREAEFLARNGHSFGDFRRNTPRDGRVLGPE